MALNILLVTSASPFAPKSGAQQRTALLHEALSRMGKVDVLMIEPGAASYLSTEKTPGICAHAYWRHRPFGLAKYKPDPQINRALASALPSALNTYDLIVGRYLNPLCKLELPDSVPTIVDLDDLGYHYGGSGGILPRQLAAYLKSRYSHHLAIRQLHRFTGFFFVSKRDQASHPDLISRVLPNIPYDVPPNPLPATGGHTLLFVGSLWYPPNRKGIDRFLAQCWSAIIARVPEARLLLAGAAPERVRRKWEQYAGVRAPGFVEDLAETYRQAALTIAPIYFGGGTNIKVLESLAHRRACVTTPHCAAAFAEDLVAGGALSVAPDDAAFIEQCVALLNSESMRAKQAQLGYAIVTTHYNKRRFFDLVAELVNEITSPSDVANTSRK